MARKNDIVTATGLLNTTRLSPDLSSDSIRLLDDFMRSIRVYGTSFPPEHQARGAFCHLTQGVLHVHHIHPGKLMCLLVVKPAIMNGFGGMHGVRLVQ
ncbi:unnamed protein product [Cuscuta europaea]|uniref:Uncharacterized protein n=1 Tax=Cuscuta europaea TaxID=41803 RepID=A0A9P0YZ55_CUSEU|nr:unnamed protein product [Cuscuta europaea]